MIGDEFHVASYVVRTRPEDAAQVAQSLVAISGLEVHAVEHGKLIVTAEARSARDLAHTADAITAVDSVLTVAPVYHEYSGAAQSAAE
jgi:nitrate reductase NapD